MHLLTENDFVNLNGTHKPDRTDADVTAVIFFHGRMSVAYPEMIFDRFPNVDTVFITGNLQVTRFANPRCQLLRFWSFEGPANAITTLPDRVFRNCFNLEEIRIQRTIISSIDENVFLDTPNLRRLLIPRNQIVTLGPHTFRSLTRLEHLDIERNAIVTFNWQLLQGMTSLRHIQCGQLNNRVWPSGFFSNLPNLVEINVNWSGLQTIEPLTFSNVPSLEIIRIYGEVRRLNSNIFATQLPRLHTLNINRNQIEAVDRKFFSSLPSLRNLIASFNICINQDFENIVNMQPVIQAFENCFSRFEASAWNRNKNICLLWKTF